MALDAAGLGQTEDACRLFLEAMDYAPEGFKRDLHEKAVDLGLMPDKPDAYTDDGQPLYLMDTMLDRLGLSENDIPDDIRQHLHVGPIHRVQ